MNYPNNNDSEKEQYKKRKELEALGQKTAQAHQELKKSALAKLAKVAGLTDEELAALQ